MPRSCRWIFHVGFPKAASSSLQTVFQQATGVHYVGRRKGGEFLGTDGRQLVREVLTGYPADEYPIDLVNKWRDEIEEMAGQEGSDTVLVSDERFLSTPVVPRSIVEIGALLKRAFGEDVHLVIVLRNPFSLLKSVYAQRIKLGLAIDFQHFCALTAARPQEDIAAQFSYAPMLQSLKAAKIGFTTLLFERLTSLPGYACDKLEPLGIRGIPQALPKNNASPDPFLLESIRRTNLARFEQLPREPIPTQLLSIVEVDRREYLRKCETLAASDGTTGDWLDSWGRFLKVRRAIASETAPADVPISFSLTDRLRNHFKNRFNEGNRGLESLVGETGLRELGYPSSVSDPVSSIANSNWHHGGSHNANIRWIFHIGYAKSGSSSLQTMFRKATGFLFAGKDGPRFYGEQGHYVIHQMLPRAAVHQIDAERFRQWKGDIERAAQQKKLNTVLVSDERFLSPQITPRHFLETAKTIRELFGDQIEFVVCIRNPLKLLMSTYTHRIKFGLAIDFQNFCFLQASSPHGNIIQQQDYSSLFSCLARNKFRFTTLILEKLAKQSGYIQAKLTPLGFSGLPNVLPSKNQSPDAFQLQTLLDENILRAKCVAELPIPQQVEMVNRAELEHLRANFSSWELNDPAIDVWCDALERKVENRRSMVSDTLRSDTPLDFSLCSSLQQWLDDTMRNNVRDLEQLTGESGLRDLGYPV